MARSKLVKKIHVFGFILLLLISVTAVFVLGKNYLQQRTQNQYQKSLAPFYTPPNSLQNGKPGDVIRYEKMDVTVLNLEAAYRILYITQLSNEETAVSSAMVFIPQGKAPSRGRTVLAWAHGTVGMGSTCAPSRSANPLSDMNWLPDALARGWVVTATDYAGLGTPGTQQYLIGESEAHDVLNSVRAAQNIKEANAGSKVLLFGHSQGGHSAIFAAMLAKVYAPELKIIAVAAAAPAAELLPLLSEQYDKPIVWGLAPEVSVSWKHAYPNLNLSDTLSESALKSYKDLSKECLNGDIDGIKFHILLQEKFYKTNPMTVSAWANAATDQTAPVLDSKVPVIIAQGLEDTVVIPGTTALYAKRACDSRSNITMVWMYGVGHISAANISGSYIISWLDQRQQAVPVVSTCTQPMPVTPAQGL